MRVLILGNNYASIVNSMAIGFDQAAIKHKAISFEMATSPYNIYTKIYKCYHLNNKVGSKRKFFQIIGFVNCLFQLFTKSIWATHLIYFSNPTLFPLNSKFVKWELAILNYFIKKKYVFFVGSDVRNTNTELSINPMFNLAWNNPNYEYKFESELQSNTIQELYRKYNFIPLVWDMYAHINKSIFNSYISCPYPSVNLQPVVANTQTTNPKVLIVHSPSAPIAKGTSFVLQAIEALKKTDDNKFEFVLLQNISNEAYQDYLNRADILIDQLIWGAYGVAAIQAMQKGVAVVCYLSPEKLNTIYGVDCPIINATPNNLATVLQQTINNSAQLQITKQQSINYYNAMHAPKAVAQKLAAAIA
jgi:hypothetical protein